MENVRSMKKINQKGDVLPKCSNKENCWKSVVRKIPTAVAKGIVARKRSNAVGKEELKLQESFAKVRSKE